MQPIITIPDHIERIGFCTDIHAQYDRVIRMTQTRDDIEYWFCAGDVGDMYKGLHFNQPTLRIMARLGISSVAGNHDLYLKRHILKRLDEEARTYLESLPFSLSIHFANQRIRIYHATPRSPDDFLKKQAGEATYVRLFEEVEANVFVLGHTHERYSKRFGSVHFINPGALGVSGIPASFCLLNREGDIEFLELEVEAQRSGAHNQVAR